MNASTTSTRRRSILGQLLVALTIGLMMLSLFAASAFATNGTLDRNEAGNGARVVSTGGGTVNLDEDDEDEDDEDDEDGEGGGGLPATDTAPELTTNTGSTPPVPAVAVLLITGLVGGAIKVAAKRRI